MANTILTQDYVRECFDYNPDTGVLTWRARPVEHFKRHKEFLIWNKRFASKLPGCLNDSGYLRVCINNKQYRAHWIIWLYVYGKFPTCYLDHINGIRSDNRLVNLREVSTVENSRNQRLSPKNTSGQTGVYFDKSRNKWFAFIHLNNRAKSLGRYEKFEDAVAARLAANKKYGFHPNHGLKPGHVNEQPVCPATPSV